MDFAASLVMNDYLDPLELRACRGVSRRWRSSSDNAVKLPRVREKAARTIQKAWRNCPRNVERLHTREVEVRANERVPFDLNLHESLFRRGVRFGGALVDFAFPRRVDSLDFFGHGASYDVTSTARTVVLRPEGSIVTNFRARGRKPRVVFKHGMVAVNILDHPNAVIPTGLLRGGRSKLKLGRGTESVSYTIFFPPGRPKTEEGPINGLPGVAIANSNLYWSDDPRRWVPRRRILGKWA